MCKLCSKQDAVIPMERRVRGNSHARCGVGENLEMISKDYLSLFPGAFSSGEPKGEDFRIVLEEVVKIKFGTAFIPGSYPWTWHHPGRTVWGTDFSLSWRIFDAEYWGVAQRRNRIFLVADFGGQSAPAILFEQSSLPGYPAPRQGAWQGASAAAQDCAHDAGGLVATPTHGDDARGSTSED